MIYCTVFDWEYAPKGLALYESIREHTNDFKLHCLCSDHRIYELISGIKDDRIIPWYSESIDDLKFRSKKYIHQETSNYSQRQHYYWSLAGRFSLWLMELLKEDVAYLDADLCFYNDIKLIETEMQISGCSVGVTPHLHNTEQDEVGAYNVSLVYFKYDKEGQIALKKWVELICNPKNKYYKVFGQCGDQGYLQIILPTHFHIFGRTFAQLAPWNFRLYDYLSAKTVILRDRAPMCPKVTINKELPVLFVHFSHFWQNSNGYESGEKNYGNFLSIDPSVKEIYDNYDKLLTHIKEKYL